MSESGLAAAVAKMRADDIKQDAIDVFTRFYRQLEDGATGLIAEDDIEPLANPAALDDLEVPDDQARAALAQTAMIRLNGGLATSMGLDRAKSLLPVSGGHSFLDIIVGQVRAARRRWDVALPVLFMNSFRTQDDTLRALATYPDLAVDGLPLDFVQNREPKLAADTLEPIEWPDDPALEWCPPGHADLYPVLRSSGVLDSLIKRGYRYVFSANADNLGAVLDPRIPAWMAAHEIPFVMECARRTPADQKGGHLAVRRRDRRLVLRESAQTSSEDTALMQDLSRHRYCNTNNVWFDLRALRDQLASGVLDLPLIRNEKPVDPARPDTPRVVQIESAMGAAIQSFDGAAAIEVPRSRFAPVKKTTDLLVVRSDRYALTPDFELLTTTDEEIAVSLDPAYYAILADFDARFPAGPPSLRDCTALRVRGDVRFGADVVARGEVELEGPQTIPDGTTLP